MILAMDTCEATCSAALLGIEGKPVAAFQDAIGRGHAEHLLPRLERLLNEAGASFEGLTRLAVTTGPGSFTGVRVGLSVVRGLGVALDIPVVGVSALEVLAHQWGGDAAEGAYVHPMMMGRGGQTFHQVFQKEGGYWVSRHEAASRRAEEVSVLLQRYQGPIVGSGARLLAEDAESAPLDPMCLARLAATRVPSECPPDPLYLREADAVAARPVFPTAPGPDA